MKEDALVRLVREAQEDRAFGEQLLADPARALRDRGYALSEDELEAVRSFHGEVAGMDSDQAAEHLARRSQEGGA